MCYPRNATDSTSIENIEIVSEILVQVSISKLESRISPTLLTNELILNDLVQSSNPVISFLFSVRLERIQKLIENTEGFSLDDIVDVSPYIRGHYLIPKNTEIRMEGKCITRAMILFNTNEREGALEEAWNLENALAGVGMTTNVEEWD